MNKLRIVCIAFVCGIIITVSPSARAQKYSLTINASGGLDRQLYFQPTASASPRTGDRPSVTGLTETLYWDPVHSQLRQVGYVSTLPTGTSSNSFVNSNNLAGTLVSSQTYSPGGTNIVFDTGYLPLSQRANGWYAPSNVPYFSATVIFSYALTTGGQTLSNTISYSEVGMASLPFFFTFNSNTNIISIPQYSYVSYANGGSYYYANYESFSLPTITASNGMTINLHSGQQPDPLDYFDYYVPTNSVNAIRVPQTNQLASAWTNNALQLTFTGDPAASAVLSYSSNLINWVPFLTNAPYGGYLTYLDTNAHTLPARFYRGATSN